MNKVCLRRKCHLTGSATLNARFPGQWFQVEAGLHYNWHRHYDPTLGRYTQTDPLGFVDGPSVYGYAVGNPSVYVDPDGQWAHIIISGTLAAGARYLVDPCATWEEIAWSGAAGAAAAAVGSPSLFFGRGGALNSNKWLRIGRSWNNKTKKEVFSVRGKIVDRISGQKRTHWDLWGK